MTENGITGETLDQLAETLAASTMRHHDGNPAAAADCLVANAGASSAKLILMSLAGKLEDDEFATTCLFNAARLIGAIRLRGLEGQVNVAKGLRSATDGAH